MHFCLLEGILVTSQKDELTMFPRTPESMLLLIREYLWSKSPGLLKKLQIMQILPSLKMDLAQAIELLKECDLFYMNTNEQLKDLLILNTISSAREKGWKTVYETYTHTNHRNYRDIQDAIADYLKTNFFPRLFRVVATLQSEEPLFHLFANEWHNTSEQALWLRDRSPLFVIGALILCKDKDLSELASFSEHWHAPLQQTVFRTVQGGKGTWPSLFQSKKDHLQLKTHKELTVPDSVTGEKDYKFISLTSHEELVKEGKQLHHCVGGYANKCQQENCHIISLVDEYNNSVSTIELSVENHKIRSVQHRGNSNSTPSLAAIKAHDWLLESLNNRTIPIDFEFLEAERCKRTETTMCFLSLEEKFSNFLGFNPFGDEGLKTMKKIKDLYRKHTPDNFKDNVHQLSHIDSLRLSFSFPLRKGKREYTVKVDLLTDEENFKKLLKQTRSLRWTMGMGTTTKEQKESKEEPIKKVITLRSANISSRF